MDDLRSDERGYVVQLPWSKTNQFGTHIDLVALPRLSNPDRCPVTAIDTWLELSGITIGPLLRSVSKGNKPGATGLSGDGVNRIVADATARAGIIPPGGGSYSAHRLRAGFVTYAHLRGATRGQIAHQTRHASLASVQTYTRIHTIWDDNAVTALGI